MSRGTQIAATIIGGVLLYGVVWGAFGIVDAWWMRGEMPRGEWWHFLLAIPIIGVIALLIEALGEGIRRALGADRRGTPKWREFLAIVVSIVAVVAILVLYNLWRS